MLLTGTEKIPNDLFVYPSTEESNSDRRTTDMVKKPAPQSCVCASFPSPHSWRRLGGDVATLKRWLAYRRTCTGRSTAQSCRGTPAQHGLHCVTGSTLDQPERSPVCSLHPTHLERKREKCFI